MPTSTIEYHDYLAHEWALFAQDPARQGEANALAREVKPRHVLDVGCGGGQDLIPFAANGAHCTGVDIAAESARWGRDRFRAEWPQATVSFVTAAAEALPFPARSFDLVLCRLAIPYTDNRAALAEMARVLSDRGALLLKTHTLAYYVHKVWEGIRLRSPLFSIHAMRVLVSGAVYHATGWQPDGRLLLREVFQTEPTLRREFARAGLRIEREIGDSNRMSRAYLVTRIASR